MAVFVTSSPPSASHYTIIRTHISNAKDGNDAYCTLLHRFIQANFKKSPFPPTFSTPNAVGYDTQDSVKGSESTSSSTYYAAPGMGVSFFPVAGGTEFDLRDIKVEGMDGDSMWIRVLRTSDSFTIGRYTYVTEDYFGEYKDMIENWENFVGWWDKDLMDDSALMMAFYGDDKAVLKEAKMFPVGTAFLAKFDGKTNVKFQSNGTVVDESTKFAFGTAQAPYFKNYLPVDTKLSDVIPVVLDKQGEIDPALGMDADAEWLRVLSSDDSFTIARYTYVSEAYFGDYKEMIEGWENFVGWWDKDLMDDSALMMAFYGDDKAVIKNADEISFPTVIGKFSGSNNMAFQFPSAFDLPSAK